MTSLELRCQNATDRVIYSPIIFVSNVYPGLNPIQIDETIGALQACEGQVALICWEKNQYGQFRIAKLPSVLEIGKVISLCRYLTSPWQHWEYGTWIVETAIKRSITQMPSLRFCYRTVINNLIITKLKYILVFTA